MNQQTAIICQPRDWQRMEERLEIEKLGTPAGVEHGMRASRYRLCAEVIEYQARVIEQLRAELRGTEMTLDGANLA